MYKYHTEVRVHLVGLHNYLVYIILLYIIIYNLERVEQIGITIYNMYIINIMYPIYSYMMSSALYIYAGLESQLLYI